MRVFRSTALAIVVVCLALEGTASAGVNATVNIANYSFTPEAEHIALAQSVVWHNTQPVAGTIHTATSNGWPDGVGTSGVGLWYTGDISPQSSSTATSFDTAGTYPYHCTHHPTLMHGTVSVPMNAPIAGTRGSAFMISWAFGSIPSGFNMDIQVNKPVRPGQTRRWVTLFANQSGSSVSGMFDPTRTGVFKFRARLQNNTTNGVSNYSPPVAVTVSA